MRSRSHVCAVGGNRRNRETGAIVPDLAESIELNKQSNKRADREVVRAEAAGRRYAELEQILYDITVDRLDDHD